jgi:molybdate-binding protein/DNA-binding XRE family transcriptional regulator
MSGIKASTVAPTTNELRAQVKELRLRQGLSQRDLAARVGVTRQAVGAIEVGTYVPNTAVALRLARALGCRVENLFLWEGDVATRQIDLAAGPPGAGRRVALGQVRGHWIAHPIDGQGVAETGFLPADAIAGGNRSRRAGPPSAGLLATRREVERAALLLGCDPALAILATLVARRNPEVRLTWVAAASAAALTAVRRGEAHAGGTHLRGKEDGSRHPPPAARALSPTGGLVISFARWEEGLMISSRARARIRSVGDLAHRDVRIVNRQRGAGARALLDERLASFGIPATRVRGYDRVVPGHVAAAAAVAAGGADAAIGLRATAAAFSLTFLPLAEERFDIAIPSDHLEHPAIATMLDLLQRRELRSDLSGLPGYDASCTGQVVAEVRAT